MTFAEIQTAVTDYCLLTSTAAQTRVGKAINRHYRRITSQIGMDASRFVTRSVGTTIGLQTVTFDEIEKIDRILDATDATAVRLLDEVSIHEQRSNQPSDGEPWSWALQHTDADAVTVLLSTTSAVSYTLHADGWTTLSDLTGADEPVIPESFHDILVWYVISEELLKKEKDKLAATYMQKAEKLLGDLRFHLADSPTRDTRQAGSPSRTLSGSGGGGSSIVGANFVRGGVNIADYASLATALTAIGSSARTLVVHQSTPVTVNTTIPANVSVLFLPPGAFVVSAGVTLTIQGSIMAPDYQIFSGLGDVVVTAPMVLSGHWFGAVGDGVADDTAEIQAAIDALADTVGGIVVLAIGTYRISAPLVMTSGVTLRGASNQGTVIKNYGNTDAIYAVYPQALYLTLEDLQIYDGLGIATRTAGHGIHFDGTASYTRFVINRCYILGHVNGIYVERVGYSSIRDVRVVSSKQDGISVNGVSTVNLTLDNCGVLSTGRYGYVLNDANFVVIAGGFADSCVDHGYFCSGGGNITLTSTSAERNSGDGYRFDATQKIVMNACSASGIETQNGIYLEDARYVVINAPQVSTITGIGIVGGSTYLDVVIISPNIDSAGGGNYSDPLDSFSKFTADGLTTPRATTPAITTTTGPLTITPAAGSGLAVALSTSGDFAVNTTQFYVDTSASTVGIGTAAPTTRLGQKLDVAASSNYGGMVLSTWASSADQSTILDITRSRSTTIGAHTALVAEDTLGYLIWRGSDGAGFFNSAQFKSMVDGTVSTGIVPGRMVFYTADAAGAVAERMRIDKSGNVGVGATSFGTSAASVLALANGTAPSTSPADMVQLFSEDLSAGNATLGLRTETAVVTETVTSDRTLSVKINGTVYKICLKS